MAKIKEVEMTKKEFKNLPDTSTPLNVQNLNQMQDDIESAINDAVATDEEIFNSIFQLVDSWEED